MSEANAKPRGRWFQFSLRALLIVVTLFVGLLVVWRVYIEPYRRQRQTMKLIEELGGDYKTERGEPAWMWDWFGAQDIVLVDVADCDDPEKYLGQIASLPRLETLTVGGQTFTDEHLSRLERLTTLRLLVLDSTDVSDDGIRVLKQTMPELAIRTSERRATMKAYAAVSALGGFASSDKKRPGQPIVEVSLGGYDTGMQLTDKKFRKVAPVLANLKHLESLDISATSISNVGLKDVAKLKQLRTLFLFSHGITDAGLKELAGLEQLEGLSMAYMKMTGVGLRHLAGLNNLKWLDYRHMSFTEAGMKELGGLKQLQDLVLSSMTFTEAGLKELARLNNLTRLHLDETNVTDVGLKHLKTLNKLQSLDLRGTQVSDTGLAHLKGLTNLQDLNLEGTQVSDAGVKELQKALPNCDISHD